MERPDLDRLRDDARNPARDWHELVIYDTSRLSREPGHRLYILEPELKELGIRVIYVASPMYDDTADGRAMAGVQGVFDKWYAEKARETMRRGLRDRVRNGACWWAPYGYEVIRRLDPQTGRTTHEVRILPHEADMVRRVYAEVLAGRSCVQITRDLNASGVATRKGGKWYPTTVREMICNGYYAGEAAFGKTQYVLPKRRRDPGITHRRRPKSSQAPREREQWMGTAQVPAIVSPDVQKRAQAVLSSNQRTHARPAATTYGLRGLLYCPLHQIEGGAPSSYSLCGHAPKRKSGAVHRFYRCHWRNLDPKPGEPLTCPNQLTGPEWDDRVWDAVIGALTRASDLETALARLQETPAQQRRQWQEAITSLEAEHEQLCGSLREQQRLLERGVYTPLEYKIASGDLLPKLQAVEDNLAHAQRSLAAIREAQVDVAAVERIAHLITKKAAQATPEERAAVLRALLTRIDVYEDRLECQGVLGDLTISRLSNSRYQLDTSQ